MGACVSLTLFFLLQLLSHPVRFNAVFFFFLTLKDPKVHYLDIHQPCMILFALGK